MLTKQSLLITNIVAAISDGLKWILTNGESTVSIKREVEHDNMVAFVLINELEKLRDVEGVNNYFPITVIGNPHQYPIDILEMVYRQADPLRRGGIYIRFGGAEIPVVLSPNILVMNDEAIAALVTVIVESSEDVQELLEFKPGGEHATKRSRK